MEKGKLQVREGRQLLASNGHDQASLHLVIDLAVIDLPFLALHSNVVRNVNCSRPYYIASHLVIDKSNDP